MTLKDELNDMWLGSVAMPAITNLRLLARNDKLASATEDAQRVMKVPISVETLLQVILKNRETLVQEFAHDFGVPFHVETIQHYSNVMQNKALTTTATTATQTDKDKNTITTAAVDALSASITTAATATIVVFDDETSASELVFGIAVNHARKRITVAFRGSVTSNDYKADFKVYMETIRDPSKPNQRLAVHSGIYQYLHRKRKDGTSKWDVVKMYLKDVMQANPVYEVYLTGHSLGGSLAILLAFTLVTEGVDVINSSPISVIAFGPMLVGDMRFRRAFATLEKERKLRCLCVVNQGDFIPLIPERGRPFTCYRRVGVYLRLSPTGEIAFSYAALAPSLFRAWLRDIPNQLRHRFRLAHTLCCVKNFAANHDVRHYTENIKSCDEDLSKVEWALFKAGREAGGFVYDVW